jgi:hypothetical protein
MSKLWAQSPDSFKMCEICVGTGEVRCSYCSGTGGRNETRYDRDYEGRSISRTEWVSCGSCSGRGTGTCSPCGGSGSKQKSSTNASRRHREAATEETFDSYEPIEEQSEAGLLDEMIASQMDILDSISKAEGNGLPLQLQIDWSSRLNNIVTTSPEAEAELKALEMEVKSYRDESPWSLSIADAEFLDSCFLSLINSGLGLLSSQSSRYQRYFGSQKPQPSAESIPEGKPILRKDIEALTKSSSPESNIGCPICRVKMKAKNLVIHFDKQHWWKEKGIS